jgi:hypothetical protein
VYNEVGGKILMALQMKTKDYLEQLEQELRAHPMVAARLSHKRDMFAAEAAVKNYVWGEPFPDQGWAGTGTARQIKFVYDQLTKKKQ